MCFKLIWKPDIVLYINTALRTFGVYSLLQGSQLTFFVEGPGPPPFELPRAPSKIWRVPPLKYITNSPIFGGPLGPQAKFHKGPIGFSGARGPYLQAPKSPVTMISNKVISLELFSLDIDYSVDEQNDIIKFLYCKKLWYLETHCLNVSAH